MKDEGSAQVADRQAETIRSTDWRRVAGVTATTLFLVDLAGELVRR